MGFDGDAGALAVSLIETKLLLNSIILETKDDARFMSFDSKYLFLATTLAET